MVNVQLIRLINTNIFSQWRKYFCHKLIQLSTEKKKKSTENQIQQLKQFVDIYKVLSVLFMPY